MSEIFDWSGVASSNNQAPPDGFPENMQYSEVNNSARELMAGLARYYDALKGLTTAGTANAYTLTVLQTISAYALGMEFVFIADRANTGAVTLNVNAVGAIAIVANDGSALTANDIIANSFYRVKHDGTQFRLMGGGIAQASQTRQGKIEIATITEALTDTTNDKAIAQVVAQSMAGITKYKDGDTTLNTTTLTDDDDLVGFTLEENAIYAIEGLLVFGNATGTPPDIKWEFQVVSGIVDRFRMTNLGGHNSLGSNTITTFAPVASIGGQNTLQLDANTADHHFLLRGLIDTGATGPVLDFQWASVALGGNVTLEQDSWISFRRIA